MVVSFHPPTSEFSESPPFFTSISPHLATIEWSGILLAGDGQTVKKSNTFNGTRARTYPNFQD